MESRFGHDFSQVRVHADAPAASSARAARAHAYTVGNDVVFAAGRYAPHTSAGIGLLAHELTHVVQQSPSASRQGASAGSVATFEHTADRVAALATGPDPHGETRRLAAGLHAPAGMQCRADDAAAPDVPMAEESMLPVKTSWRTPDEGGLPYPTESSIVMDGLVPGINTRVRLRVFSFNHGEGNHRATVQMYYQETGLRKELTIPDAFAQPVVPKVVDFGTLHAALDLGPTRSGDRLRIAVHPTDKSELEFGYAFGPNYWVFRATKDQRESHGKPGWLNRLFDWTVRNTLFVSSLAVSGAVATVDTFTGGGRASQWVSDNMVAPTDDPEFRPLWDLRMRVRDALEVDTRSLDYLDVILEGVEQAVWFIFGGAMAEWAGWLFKALVGKGWAVIKVFATWVAKTKGWAAACRWADAAARYFGLPELPVLREALRLDAAWLAEEAAMFGKWAGGIPKAMKEAAVETGKWVAKGVGGAGRAVGRTLWRPFAYIGRKVGPSVREGATDLAEWWRGVPKQVVDPHTGAETVVRGRRVGGEVVVDDRYHPLNRAVDAVGDWGRSGRRSLVEMERSGRPPSGSQVWVDKSTNAAGERVLTPMSTPYRWSGDPAAGAGEVVADIRWDPMAAAKDAAKWVKPDLTSKGSQMSMAFAAFQNILQQVGAGNTSYEKFNARSVLVDMGLASIGQSFAINVCSTWKIGVGADRIKGGVLEPGTWSSLGEWTKDLVHNQTAFAVYGSISSAVKASAARTDQEKTKQAGQIKGLFTLSRTIGVESLVSTERGAKMFPGGRKNPDLVFAAKIVDNFIDWAIRDTLGIKPMAAERVGKPVGAGAGR
jgi:hypothetical protein